MNTYFADPCLRNGTREPQDDLVSAMAAARDHDDALDGGRTGADVWGDADRRTRNHNESHLVWYARTPYASRSSCRLLRDDPVTLPRMRSRRFLRYDSPFQSVPRTVTQPRRTLERATTWRQSDLVYAMLGAANRDPAQFTAPDQLGYSDGAEGKADSRSATAFITVSVRHWRGWKPPLPLQRLLARFPDAASRHAMTHRSGSAAWCNAVWNDSSLDVVDTEHMGTQRAGRGLGPSKGGSRHHTERLTSRSEARFITGRGK